MNITKELKGNELIVSLDGRLDTESAPSLEKVVTTELQGVTKLVFDFKDIIYVSSAGLRVILLAQKTMAGKGELTLRNVSKDVMDIFELTGFNDLLNIE